MTLVWRVIRGVVSGAVSGVFCVLTVLGASAVSAQPTPSPVARGFATAPDVSMRVYVPAGRVRVIAWARDSVHVVGTIDPTASFFGGGARTHVKLGVEARGTGSTTLPRADWVLQVPRGARLWVKMVDGELEVRGTTGDIELYNVRGRLLVQEARGVVSIESIDATVSVRDMQGDLRVRGSRGAVTLDDVSATVSVATVSGAVHVRGGSPEGRVESIGGPLSVQGIAWRGQTLELQSHNGDITLAVPRAAPPQLTLSSRSGAVVGDTLNGVRRVGELLARTFKGRITITH